MKFSGGEASVFLATDDQTILATVPPGATSGDVLIIKFEDVVSVTVSSPNATIGGAGDLSMSLQASNVLSDGTQIAGNVTFSSAVPASISIDPVSGFAEPVDYGSYGNVTLSAQSTLAPPIARIGTRSATLSNYVVTTYAGDTGDSSGSTNGPGTTARFYKPIGLAIDPGGVIYVADQANNRIRKILIDGNVFYFGAAKAFQSPRGLFIDPTNLLWVTDNFQDYIGTISQGGATGSVAGVKNSEGFLNSTQQLSKFKSPMGVIYRANGSILVADDENSKIRIITGGRVGTFAGGVSGSSDGATDSARFNTPRDIVLDASGDLLIADFGSGIRKISGNTVSTVAAVPGGALSMDHDGSGNIFVGGFTGGVSKIWPDGTVKRIAGVGASASTFDAVGTKAQFYELQGLRVRRSNSTIFVSDFRNHNIRKLVKAP